MTETTQITKRLAGLGSAKWEIFYEAKRLIAQGREIIELTIGEPDVPTPETMIEVATDALRRGRTNYSDGRGEIGLREALADRYTKSAGRVIGTDQVLCFPGTQTALFTVLMGIAEHGSEVIVGDPMYATYEGVIRASGADMVAVPLRSKNGFRMRATDIAERITPRTKAIFLNTPHNPTGAILTATDLDEIGALAKKHDLWIISDEVYDELVFEGVEFTSALSRPDLADRTIIVSSISKSHAAPGFRSGWSIGPAAFTEALLPLSETMLFGNQPFIADMTEAAIWEGSPVAPGMRQRFAARAALLQSRLSAETSLVVNHPQAGMFALIDISSTGMNSDEYAHHLLDHAGVAVMPGSSFGTTMDNWVRVALTVDDALFETACERIIQHSADLGASCE